MSKQSPKLRTVNKSVAAFPLNEFPKDFPFLLGKELIYLLASKGKPELEGSDWESIFASCIGADWKPSNVGLDDCLLYTSDAADDLLCVDLGGRRIIKKKNKTHIIRVMQVNHTT